MNIVVENSSNSVVGMLLQDLNGGKKKNLKKKTKKKRFANSWLQLFETSTFQLSLIWKRQFTCWRAGMPFRQVLTSCRNRSAGMSCNSRTKNWKFWMSWRFTKENEAPPQEGPMIVADKRLWISRAFFLWRWTTMYLVAMTKELSAGYRSNYSPLLDSWSCISWLCSTLPDYGHQNKRHKNLKQSFRRPIRWLWDWSKEMMNEFGLFGMVKKTIGEELAANYYCCIITSTLWNGR